MKMNKITTGMFAMASMLLATSCSNDDLQGMGANGNFVTARFNVTAPEGMKTRAIGDGETVNKVVCATYDARGVEMTDLRQYLGIQGKQAQYSIRLAKGQDYRVAFFAYYDADGDNMPEHYNIADLKNIQILGDQLSNVEQRDAFTAYYDIEHGATMQPIEKDITLYRPFAQLNLGSYKEDWAAAVSAGVTVNETQVTVSNVYNAFSAYDDVVVGETSEVTFALNELPAKGYEWLYADVDLNGTPEEYKYLALNYLLVGDKNNEKNLTDIKFTWSTADGKSNSPVTEFKNIPVQRNYRTNILGWLLTNPAVFNITIDERFEKPDYNIIAVDGTVNVEEFSAVENNDGFMNQPANVATIADKHITADETAIVLDKLPAGAEGGVLYIKNSIINAKTFLDIQGQYTVIVRNCRLNVETVLKNSTNRRDLQIHFEDCYVNGTPLTKDNKTQYIDVEDFGTVTARFNGAGEEKPENPGDDNTGDDNTGDDNTGDDNTGDDNQGVAEDVKMSEEKDNLGEIYNNQFFYIHDKEFKGTVTIDAQAYGDLYYFENVHFDDYIYIKKSQTLIFDNCTFSKKGLVINQTGDTTVQIQARGCTVNGETVTSKDLKGSGW